MFWACTIWKVSKFNLKLLNSCLKKCICVAESALKESFNAIVWNFQLLMSVNIGALLRRKPVSAGTCCAEEHKKKDTCVYVLKCISIYLCSAHFMFFCFGSQASS